MGRYASAADIENPAAWQSVANSAIEMTKLETATHTVILVGSSALGFVAFAKKKPAIACDICIETNRQPICNTLEALLVRGGGGAVLKGQIQKKLCASAKDNTTISALASKLTAFSSTEINAFMTELSTNCSGTNLCKDNVSADMAEVWKVLYAWKNHRKELSYLNKIGKLLRNENIKVALNQMDKVNLNLICNALNSPKTSVKFNNSQTLKVYLDAFEIAVNKFHAKTGFKIRDGAGTGKTNGAVKELTIANSRNLDGGWFGIREMNQLEASNVSRIDWDFDDDAYDCGNNSCQFDVEMVAGQTPRYYEYKSKFMNTDADSPVEINPKQFKAYLSKIANMAELQYVFQTEKLYKGGGTTFTLEQGLANRFKKLISNDIDGFFNVIWGNDLLRRDIWKNDSPPFPTNPDVDPAIKLQYKAKFSTLVGNTNNSIYNFIQVK